jgi:serine protease Do
MIRNRGVWLLAAAVLAAGCAGGPKADPPYADVQVSIARAKQRVYPTLVFVKPIREVFERGEREREEVFGSGVIISPDGYVLTNHHVAEKAIQVNCVLGDKEQVTAKVIGLDPETDLALLKLEVKPSQLPLPYAEFGDSDKIEEGQFVMALGSPFGFTRSISLGIISNTRRYIGFSTQYQYNLWLQTDAAINPGNSGGPLVDAHGMVVGINTLGTFAEGIGFAIPSNVAQDTAKRLKDKAASADPNTWPVKVERAYTGLQIQALQDFNTNTFTTGAALKSSPPAALAAAKMSAKPERKDSRITLAAARTHAPTASQPAADSAPAAAQSQPAGPAGEEVGVLVKNAEQHSPAEDAGIQPGDLVLKIGETVVDGRYVEQLPAIRRILADLPIDKPTLLTISRNGEEIVIPVMPVLKGKFEGEDFELRRWNFTVKEITKFSNPTLHFQHGDGVFIQGVRYPGNAQDAGLAANDILVKIGQTPIKTIADAKAAYEQLVNDKALADKKVLITIKRGGFQEPKLLDWTKDYMEED